MVHYEIGKEFGFSWFDRDYGICRGICMQDDSGHYNGKLSGEREDQDLVFFLLIQFLKCKPDITVISSTPQTIIIKVYSEIWLTIVHLKLLSQINKGIHIKYTGIQPRTHRNS